MQFTHIYIGFSKRNAMTFWPQFFRFFSESKPLRILIFPFNDASLYSFAIPENPSWFGLVVQKCWQKYWAKRDDGKGTKSWGWCVCSLFFPACALYWRNQSTRTLWATLWSIERKNKMSQKDHLLTWYFDSINVTRWWLRNAMTKFTKMRSLFCYRDLAND